MKITLNKKQWQAIGKQAGWTGTKKIAQTEQDHELTETRTVKFYDGNGKFLDSEVFSIRGLTESERFQKFDAEVEEYMNTQWENPEDIEWHDTLDNVEG